MIPVAMLLHNANAHWHDHDQFPSCITYIMKIPMLTILDLHQLGNMSKKLWVQQIHVWGGRIHCVHYYGYILVVKNILIIQITGDESLLRLLTQSHRWIVEINFHFCGKSYTYRKSIYFPSTPWKSSKGGHGELIWVQKQLQNLTTKSDNMVPQTLQTRLNDDIILMI